MSVPPALGPAFGPQDKSHLSLLSLFHYVFAGFGLLGGCFMVGHYWLMQAMMTGQFPSQSSAPPPPPEVFMMMKAIYVIGGFMLVLGMAANIISAVFLRQGRHRIFSMVVAGLNCLQFPFGTVLGVFTFVVLMRETVREGYERVVLEN